MEAGGLARRSGAHYLGAMSLPRPASPRVLIADIRAFLAQRTRVQLFSFAGALLMPVVLIWLFVMDSASLMPGPRVVYIESYPSTRTDEEIRADQLVRQREAEQKAEETRRRWQALGNATGVNP